MADRTFYPAGGNTNYERDISFKILLDGANPPTLAGSPLNNYIASCVRVSQGVFRITLSDPYRFHVTTAVELNVNGATARWAQPGPVANFGQAASAGLPTVDILIVDNSSNVQDPAAANANNFISGTVVCCDVAGQ